jgi:thiol:disulfide interchange protein DsbA
VPQKGAPQKSSQKIEVLEFFSYGCPHCASMHPHITKWSEALPGNVEFVRVPVAFGRREWGMLSRTYYTLQNLGELKRLDGAVFDAIHQQQQPMSDEAAITAWAVKQGINENKFRSEFNSERVNKAVANAETLSRDMMIDSVPKIVVAQRYKVVAEDAKSYGDIFSVADRVIDKAAKEKSAQR